MLLFELPLRKISFILLSMLTLSCFEFKTWLAWISSPNPEVAFISSESEGSKGLRPVLLVILKNLAGRVGQTSEMFQMVPAYYWKPAFAIAGTSTKSPKWPVVERGIKTGPFYPRVVWFVFTRRNVFFKWFNPFLPAMLLSTPFLHAITGYLTYYHGIQHDI